MNNFQKQRDEVRERTMQVRTTSQQIGEWKNQAIVRSLSKETGVADG